jgi:GT2 family glycosyltransferase
VKVDVLIPTYRRPAALAVTLTSLTAQTFGDFRVVISDQTEDADPCQAPEAMAAIRVLRFHGQPVEAHKHLPRLGMAEQRQFLLDHATAPCSLFIDDDLILERDLLTRLAAAMDEQHCGFVGSAVIGLSYLPDVREQEQDIELWEERVRPEVVRPGTAAWERYRLHNAANMCHVQERLRLTPQTGRLYHVAWVGGCVLYDTAKLRAVGGFGFWRDLPRDHAGEDVLAQQRVMARFGGCGLIPSGAYHQELPTTLPRRDVDAPRVLSVDPNMG